VVVKTPRNIVGILASRKHPTNQERYTTMRSLFNLLPRSRSTLCWWSKRLFKTNRMKLMQIRNVLTRTRWLDTGFNLNYEVDLEKIPKLSLYRRRCKTCVVTNRHLHCMSSSFNPLLGRTRSLARCCSIIRRQSIVSSSRTVRPCTPWGGRWIGEWRTTWSTVCTYTPHSQATERDHTPFI